MPENVYLQILAPLIFDDICPLALPVSVRPFRRVHAPMADIHVQKFVVISRL